MSLNPNIPQPNDKVKSSQPTLLSNNQALDNIFARNHYQFSLSDGTQGKHKFVELIAQPSIPTPIPPLIQGEGTFYTKVSTFAGDDTPKPSNLFYTPDSNDPPNEYQLTRTINTKFSKFASASIINANAAGWSYLPGGLLLLYGTIAATSSSPTVTFATLGLPDFQSPPFSIQVTRSNDTNQSNSFSTKNEAKTGFDISNYDGHTWAYFWIAIGK